MNQNKNHWTVQFSLVLQNIFRGTLATVETPLFAITRIRSPRASKKVRGERRFERWPYTSALIGQYVGANLDEYRRLRYSIPGKANARRHSRHD